MNLSVVEVSEENTYKIEEENLSVKLSEISEENTRKIEEENLKLNEIDTEVSPNEIESKIRSTEVYLRM